MEDKALLDAIRAIVREEVQAETGPLKADVAAMQSDIDILKASVIKHDHETMPLLKLIHEQLDGMADSPRKIKMLESTAVDHETRIWALESVVKAQ